MSRALRRYGARGTASRLWGRVGRWLYLAEVHIWYELDLAARLPSLTLPDDLTLRPGTFADASLLEAVADTQPRELADTLAQGGQLWLALDGDEGAFACWIFRERTPVPGGPGGWLDLPEGTACLEGSVTAPTWRGRGVAPAVWSTIARQLADDGLVSLVTKIEETNTPSRRAIVKARFREVARMKRRRIGPATRLAASPLGQRPTFLVAQINGNCPPR